MKKPVLILAALVVAIAAAFGVWRWRDRAGPALAEGPVILISIDTLRADRLPAYGYRGTSTPNIDRLAADGVLFENAYSHSPQTLPAHTSILTGRLPFEHGVRDNVGFTLQPGEATLQGTLREGGFSTGGFVSAYVLRRQVGIDQGFEHYDDELPPASPDKPLGQMQRSGMDTFTAASRWVDARTSPKFFLFFHIYEPHRPYTPPAHITNANAYDGEVEHADEIVGKLIEHLRAKGLYDVATIVLLSDHGEGLGDHGEDEHGIFLYRETIRVPLVIKLPGSTGAGTRVAAPVQHVDILPTVLDLFRLKAEATSNQRGQAEATRDRGGQAEATRDRGGQAEATRDRAGQAEATTDQRGQAEATRDRGGQAEATNPREASTNSGVSRGFRLQAEGTQGRSLLPVLTGTGTLAPANIYSEALSPRYHFGWSELYALSDERYRLVRAPKDELYDLAQDPRELKSIAAERAQVAGAMRAVLDGMIAGTNVAAPSAVSDEDRQKLAALGYVGTQTGSALQLPGDRLPDPKDRIGVLQKYKRATDLAGARNFSAATALYRELLAGEPGMTDVWLQLADLYNRQGMTAQAVDAFKEVVKRNPKDIAGLTGAASGLLSLRKLDEARAHAELAVETAPATAHELLARIAVERRDWPAARRHAEQAQQADPTLPLPAFIEGVRLHAGQQYAAATAELLKARGVLEKRTVQLPDVNYYLGDSLARLERYPEAERYFLEEISIFPSHIRSRAGLAMLYRAQGRDGDAERAVNELLRVVPTPDAYDVAAQLWTMFGEPQKAAAVRARLRRGPG